MINDAYMFEVALSNSVGKRRDKIKHDILNVHFFYSSSIHDKTWVSKFINYVSIVKVYVLMHKVHILHSYNESNYSKSFCSFDFFVYESCECFTTVHICVIQLMLLLLFDVGHALSCYQCVGTHPGCTLYDMDWRFQQGITCPRVNDRCIKVSYLKKNDIE